MDVAFGIQSYKDDSLPASAQEQINAYSELLPPDAKTPVKISGVPGLDVFATLGAGPVRGGIEVQGVDYVVSHQELYSLKSDGSQALLGAGIGGSNLVGMDSTGNEIAITNGSGGWVYNIQTEAFAQITDSNFNAANTVTAIDNYFLFDEAQVNNEFFISPLLAGLGPYDATQFGTADAGLGRVLSVHNVYGNLGVSTEHTTEFWQDTGALSFPWQRIQGTTLETGIAAPFAWAEADNGHFWLGDDLVFYRLVSGVPQRLSTHALETQWAQYASTADAFCHVVRYGGHKWVCVTFPTGNASFLYDIASQLWHRRSSWSPDGTVGRWRANCSWFAFNKFTLIGDSQSGQIGKLNPNTYTELGNPIVIDITGPHHDGHGLEMFFPEFALDMETGVGLASGQGSSPQIALLYSDDGGKTWSNENWQTLGGQGQYLTRVRWTSLGQAWQRAYRVKCSDPVKFRILRARAPGMYYAESDG